MMTALRALWTAVILGALALAPGAAMAAGTALGVKPQAELDAAGIVKTLVVGSDIQIGDQVRTGAKGLVQIKFDDKTELVVGPNSSLVIKDYLLRGDNSAGKLAISALAGTFRFATGTAPKDRYTIETPTGTIGVRGTGLDFIVSEEGTQVLLYHGAVILCNKANQCVTLDGTCQVGEYDLSQSQVIGPSIKTEGDLRDALEKAFPYANSQSPLLPSFWFDQARECFNTKVTNETPPSLVTGEGHDSYVPPGDDCGQCSCDTGC